MPGTPKVPAVHGCGGMSHDSMLAPPTAQENERMAAYMDDQARRYASHGHDQEASDCRRWAASYRRSAAIQRAKGEPNGQGVLDFGGAA